MPDERLRTALIADKLSQEYGRLFQIEIYRWEHEALIASKHFQDALEPPSAFDIVVLILWSRLGTPLPEKTSEREYRGIDGRVPVTGTEWEYEEALRAARQNGAPDLLAFRKVSPAPIDPIDTTAQAQSMDQLAALNAFWTRHFVDRDVFLSAFDEYRTLEEFAVRFEQSLRKLIERRAKNTAAAGSEPLWLGDPFRGLESYEFEHAPIFFGRDAAITKAAEQVAINARSGSAFLLVSGASGSGKSSLVKAGVVPRLMKPQRVSGISFLRRCVFRPALASESKDLFLAFADALMRGSEPDIGLPELVGPGQGVADLASYLRSSVDNPGFTFNTALGRLTEAARQTAGLLACEEAKLLLVVDQLEELFTLPVRDHERRSFIRLLAGLARSGGVWVIATLRADFWSRAAEIPELIALAAGHGRLDLSAASPAELAEMVRKPAQASGLSFEAHFKSSIGLDAILAEHAAAAPGALPLLSFTLDELYRNARARMETVLTHASYEALGGLEGAIAKRADEVLATLPREAQASLPRVLRALTTVSGSAELPVARPASLAAFAEDSPASKLIEAFVAARLLVATSERETASIRLAHEALISRWQRAQQQLALDRRDLEIRALVEQQFDRWRTASGFLSRWQLLLRNPDLANAVDLGRRWKDEIEPPIRNFVRRSSQRARISQSFTAAAAVLFAIVAVQAFYSERKAQSEARRAEIASNQERLQRDQAQLNNSRFLSDLANQSFQSGELTKSTLLALEALPSRFDVLDRPYFADAEAVLSSSFQQASTAGETIKVIQIDAARDEGIKASHFSADGQYIFVVADEGHGKTSVTVWDVNLGKQVQGWAYNRFFREAIKFSPDREKIALLDRGVEIRRATTGEALVTLDLSSGIMSKPAVAFSPDGGLLLVSSKAGISLWDANSGNSSQKIFRRYQHK